MKPLTKQTKNELIELLHRAHEREITHRDAVFAHKKATDHLLAFVQGLNLYDMFWRSMDGEPINLEDARRAIDNACPCCRAGCAAVHVSGTRAEPDNQ